MAWMILSISLTFTTVPCSAALAVYIATPHDATHGMWSAAQHISVLRAIFLRSFNTLVLLEPRRICKR